MADTYHTTTIGQIASDATLIYTNYLNVDTLSYARENKYRKWYGTTLSTNITIQQSSNEPIVCPVISRGEDDHEK